MSDQQAPPIPGGAEQGTPPGVGAKPYDIQRCAHDAQTALEKLATELGKSDADPEVIKAISGYADDCASIAKSFAAMLDQSAQATGQPTPPPAGGDTMESATDALADQARRQ